MAPEPFSNARYRVTNWPEYDAALVRRGSLTVWFTEGAVEAWHAPATGERGGQPIYSAIAIETGLALRLVFHQPLHQTAGLLRSIADLLGVDIAIPDHIPNARRNLAMPHVRKQGSPVESRRGAVSFARPVSPPRSSNRTCGFPASGFPTGFTASSRKGPKVHIPQSQHAQRPEYNCIRVASVAAGGHLVSAPQKRPNAIVNVPVDRSISHQPRPVTEVIRPPSQHAIQAIPYLGPRCHVPRHQQISHFLPQLGNALLRRTRPKILVTIRPHAMWSEAVSQKIEPLSPCLLHAGLRLVQRESDPGHHTPRPIQCLGRATATENHEIIRVVDHLGSENLTPPGDPPVLQKTVHVQVGEQGTDDASLWGATGAALPTADPRFPVFVPLLNR